MTLYAYCNSPLHQHSLNVLKRLETFIERRDTVVICNRIAGVLGRSREDMGELSNQCLKLARLAALLHDAGKGLEVYQDPTRYMLVEGKCKASYPFHEVFSAIIVKRLMEKVLIRHVKLKELRSIPILVALYHHYTMERLDKERIRNYMMRDLKGRATIHVEVADIIADALGRVFDKIGVGKDIVRVIKERVLSKPIKMSDIGNLFSYVNSLYLANKPVFLLTFGIVGQVAVADYITASMERGGSGSKYYESICEEAKWICARLGDA